MPVTKICPRCQAPAEMQAAQCVRCGRAFRTTAPQVFAPPPPPAPHQPPQVTLPNTAGGFGHLWKTSDWFRWTVIVLFVWFFVCRPIGNIKPPPGGSESGAEVAAMSAVRARLKAPSTAKFDHFSFQTTKSREKGWIVIGSVDAQNSFGAMIRNTFVCELEYDSKTDSYRVVSAVVNGL